MNPDENLDEIVDGDDLEPALPEHAAASERDFAAEPTAHNIAGPQSDAAPAEPKSAANSAAAANASDKELSEAEIDELIQRIADEMAARQASSGGLSTERLEGIALHFVEKANARSHRDGDETMKPPGAEADHGQSAPLQQRDESSRAVERFGGGIFQRPEPAPSSNAEKLAAVPPIVVMVQLADARAIQEDERRASSKEMADMLEHIADERIKLAFWRHENARRAADPRLRGPSW